MSGGSSSGGPSGGGTAGRVGGGAAVTATTNGGAGLLRGLRSGLPLPVHDHETPSTGGELDDYLRPAWGTDHLADADPHEGYLTQGEADALYAPVAGGGYLTEAAGDLRYEPLDSAYTKAESDDAYATVDHAHPSQQTAPWRFQNTAAIADPGDGNFRSNTGSLLTATALALSRTTQDGYDTPASGYGVVAGDTIYIQDRDDNTKWVRLLVMDPLVRFPTYVTSSVTVIGSAGTITDSQICQLTFTLAGGGGGGGTTDYLTQAEADALYLTPAHTALPNAHHAQAHDHTTGDSSGVLSNDEHDGYSQYVNLGADPSTPAANRIRLYSKDNGSGVSTLYYRSESGTVYEMPTLATGGGSGAPANASYVTLAAETKLSAETALGAGVVMSGVLASRPAFGTAGRLYLATDTDLVYRDTGSAWETFAQRTGGALTGPASGVWNTAGAPSGAPKLMVQSSAPGSPTTGDLWVW